MQVSKYLGKHSMGRTCECCKTSIWRSEWYEIIPSAPLLVDWKFMLVCIKCAQREAGKKKWKIIKERLHAEFKKTSN